MTFSCRAAVRRALVERPDAARIPLGPRFTDLAVSGPLTPDEVDHLLATYLLDPRTGALLAASEPRAQWLELPLFTCVTLGRAAPLDDQIAALIVAPALGGGSTLAPMLIDHRFAPRSDDVLALAVAALDLPAQAAALETLFNEPGPEPATLALSILQCGRVLAWAPHLLEWPIADHVVTALLALLDAARPAPLLETVTHALGPIASRPGPLPDRVRAAARDAIRSTDAGVAAGCAYILGFATPADREGRPTGMFADGLVAAANIGAVSQLVAGLLTGDGDLGRALDLASRLPLDPIGGLLVDQLDADGETERVHAIAAVELLDSTDHLNIDAALAQRLSDPSPEVTAAAVRTLIARGRLDLVGEQRSARSGTIVREDLARPLTHGYDDRATAWLAVRDRARRHQ